MQAGLLGPLAIYLMLRLILDLGGGVMQAWWGYGLLLVGGVQVVVQGWQAATKLDLDTIVAGLAKRQTGLALIGVGLAVVAVAADLPVAEALAVASVCLVAIEAALGGTLTSVTAHIMGGSGGTYRLSRLGGLIHTMPATSTSMAAGLLTLSALPFGLGFASLWLSFQSILAAPRSGGLLSQLPLAVAVGALALSAALATAASIRIIGIAILGRPRTPQGAGAAEPLSVLRTCLLVFAALSFLAGLLPGALLWVAGPLLKPVTGVTPPISANPLSLLGTNGYSPPAILGMIALATGAALSVARQPKRQAKVAGSWSQGMQPPAGLPFGDPAAQSVGAGFVPQLPLVKLPRLPQLDAPPLPKLSPIILGAGTMLTACALLLLSLAVLQ